MTYKKSKNNTRELLLFAGGGTGGHIFTGLAIIEEIKKQQLNVQILFVGAKNKMETHIVPKYNIPFKEIYVAGFQRKKFLKNIKLPFILLIGFIQSFFLLIKWKPKVAIGVGGYVSLPILWVAQWLRIPTIIIEQNSYPGLANKILARRADRVCTGFPNMDRFFAKEKIIFTGNPIRNTIMGFQKSISMQKKARGLLGLNTEKKTILILGGSLGAGSINKSISLHYPNLLAKNYQIIWQSGKYYYDKLEDSIKKSPHICVKSFFEDMLLIYQASDVVVSRAGALSIAEIIYTQKPAIIVPSPNVADDHQTKNAQALKQKQASIIVEDNCLEKTLLTHLHNILETDGFSKKLVENLYFFFIPNSNKVIVNQILNYCNI